MRLHTCICRCGGYVCEPSTPSRGTQTVNQQVSKHTMGHTSLSSTRTLRPFCGYPAGQPLRTLAIEKRTSASWEARDGSSARAWLGSMAPAYKPKALGESPAPQNTTKTKRRAHIYTALFQGLLCAYRVCM